MFVWIVAIVYTDATLSTHRVHSYGEFTNLMDQISSMPTEIAGFSCTVVRR